MGEGMRTFRPRSLATALARLGSSAPHLLRALSPGGIAPALRERIFLSVSGANRCRYCAVVHAHWGRLEGLSQEEVLALIGGDFSAYPAHQQSILAYARAYADGDGQVDAAAVQALQAACGHARAAQVEALVRAIQVANLSGNTFAMWLEIAARRRPLAQWTLADLLMGWLFFALLWPLLGPMEVALRCWPPAWGVVAVPTLLTALVE